MTFVQWLEKNHPNTYAVKDMHGVRDWIAFAEQAWNAAREDSCVPKVFIVEPYETECWSEKDWQVVLEETGETLVWCKTEQRCKEWCAENGFRIK